jgi:hypothetical protein
VLIDGELLKIKNTKGDVQVDIENVPENVRRVALANFPDISFSDTEVEMEKDQVFFELKGVRQGKDVELELFYQGDILELEEDEESEAADYDDD